MRETHSDTRVEDTAEADVVLKEQDRKRTAASPRQTSGMRRSSPKEVTEGGAAGFTEESADKVVVQDAFHELLTFR